MLQIVLYFILFFLTVMFGMPIAIALGLTGILIASLQGIFNPVLLGHVMYQGVDHFSLLAVPFFMLAGTLMEAGGISRRLMDFSFALVGRMRGGLAQVAVVLSMLFAGLSGSAVADTAAVGSLIIPSMREKGYREGFSAALIAAGGAIGPIIPPSIPMVIYAVIANVSVAKLFLGGVIPGVAFGLFLMAYSYYEALRHDYPRETSAFSLGKLARTFQGGFLAFLMPVIILGGILSGIFTATESSVVAAVYAFVVGKFIYGELKWKELPEVFARAARNTSSVMFIIAVASFLSWVLTSQQIPQTITKTLFSISQDPLIILILLNIFILFLGCFIDAVSILVLISPVALPLIKLSGIDPVYFGVLLVLNICIGALTPPVGTCLFVASGVGNVDLEKSSRAILPIVLIAVISLFLAILFPSVIMYLPTMIQ
ncbi:MAG: TRAP transporter large permease [Synergistales bacterium]|nr:TRAP transporter large permease [Synergistales bacterium]